MIVHCSVCGQPLSQSGTTFYCPSCLETAERPINVPAKPPQKVPVKPPMPPVPVEDVLSKEAVTAGELRSWLSRCAGYPAAIRFSDGQSQSRTLDLLYEDIRNVGDNDPVFWIDEVFLLKTMRTQRGYICLEFGESAEYIIKQIQSYEREAARSRSVHVLVRRLLELEAEVEGGASINHFSSQLASMWICVKDFEREYPESQWILLLAKGAFRHFRAAADTWLKRGGSGVAFSGGGFGLKGAATGMAIGMGLNAIAGSMANSRNASLDSIAKAHWQVASVKLATLEAACSQA